MKTREIYIIVLMLTFAVSACLVGYWFGYSNGLQNGIKRTDDKFLISVHDALYHSAENHDIQKLTNTLGMVLLGEVREYQQRYGDEAGTNSFARRFSDAKLIADRVQGSLVPVESILSNIPHAPDAAVRVEGN